MELVIDELTMVFGEQTVLDNVSYRFESGKIYALLGRNGAGKTTFFNCLAEDIKATSMQATICVDGERRQLQPDDIGYVISTPSVPAFLTGREFIKFIIDMHDPKNTEKEVDRQINDYFDYLDIQEEDRDKLMKDYSHGMKNKVQMLVNIITHPNILFLDEPLTSLDVVMAEKMKTLIKELKDDYIIIFSTHMMELALDLCDSIVLLHNAKMSELNIADLEKTNVKEEIIRILSDGDIHE